MPTYVYEILDKRGKPTGRTFETVQPIKAAALTKHPETGEPVRRVFGAPNAPRAWTDAQAKASTSDASLARHGFTKYVKTDQGTYEKTTGTGPKKIKRK